MAQNFKVTLGIKKQPGDDPVYFKVDGGRFDSEKTLKLNVNCKYSFEFQFKPAYLIDRLNIQGTNMEAEIKKRDESESVYKVDWTSSGVDQDKRGKRQQIPLLLEIRDVGTFKVNFQCKFYPEAEKNHSHWGTMVSYIEYDCRKPENSTYIDILKETYR